MVLERSVTAVVLSRTPLQRSFALPVHNVVGVYTNHSEMYEARLKSLQSVETPWCCWVDDDDDLPDNVQSVVEECIWIADRVGVPLAYTAEIVNDPERWHVRIARPYDRAKHLKESMFVHHLALMRTDTARAVISKLPSKADMWAELAVFYGLGAHGAVALNKIGYHWNVHSGGVHCWPDMSHVQLNTRRFLAGH